MDENYREKSDVRMHYIVPKSHVVYQSTMGYSSIVCKTNFRHVKCFCLFNFNEDARRVVARILSTRNGCEWLHGLSICDRFTAQHHCHLLAPIISGSKTSHENGNCDFPARPPRMNCTRPAILIKWPSREG